MKKRPTEPTEHAEQAHVIQWAELNAGKWPCLRLLHAIPNGAFFGGEMKTLKGGQKVPVAAIRARKLKAEGLREGVPDLCLPVPSGSATRGLYIEMKRRTQGKPSPMQTWWRQCLNLMGYRAELCHGAAEAIEVLRQHVQHAPKMTLPPIPEMAKPVRTFKPVDKAKPAQAKKPMLRRPFLIPPPVHG